MMLDEICQKNSELLSTKIDSQLNDLINDSKGTEFANTLGLLVNLQKGINDIVSGILILAECHNLQPFCILERSFYEYYVRIQYLFMKYMEIKDDLIGLNYTNINISQETKEHYKNINLKRKLQNKNEIPDTIQDVINTVTKGYDGKVFINDVLSFKSMLLYVIEQMKKNNTEMNIHKRLLTKYSFLSSFIHGGTTSINLNEGLLFSINKRVEYIEDRSNEIFMMNITSLISVFSFGSLINKKYKLIALDMQQYIIGFDKK